MNIGESLKNQAMTKVINKVCNPVHIQVSNQVYSKVCSKVCNPVHSQVSNQVWIQIRNSL
jgi:hypothetical protein